MPPEFSRDIVKHFCQSEWVAHLDDVMVRRAGWHYYYKDADARAGLVASWMREFLNWPDEVVAKEIERYQEMTSRTESR